MKPSRICVLLLAAVFGLSPVLVRSQTPIEDGLETLNSADTLVKGIQQYVNTNIDPASPLQDQVNQRAKSILGLTASLRREYVTDTLSPAIALALYTQLFWLNQQAVSVDVLCSGRCTYGSDLVSMRARLRPFLDALLYGQNVVGDGEFQTDLESLLTYVSNCERRMERGYSSAEYPLRAFESGGVRSFDAASFEIAMHTASDESVLCAELIKPAPGHKALKPKDFEKASATANDMMVGVLRLQSYMLGKLKDVILSTSRPASSAQPQEKPKPAAQPVDTAAAASDEESLQAPPKVIHLKVMGIDVANEEPEEPWAAAVEKDKSGNDVDVVVRAKAGGPEFRLWPVFVPGPTDCEQFLKAKARAENRQIETDREADSTWDASFLKTYTTPTLACYKGQYGVLSVLVTSRDKLTDDDVFLAGTKIIDISSGIDAAGIDKPGAAQGGSQH